MERSDGHGRRDGDEAWAVENHERQKKAAACARTGDAEVLSALPTDAYELRIKRRFKRRWKVD